MHVSRALLKNTRASIHFHRRFLIFLVALLVVIIVLVMVASTGIPQILTAQTYSSDDDGDSGQGNNGAFYSYTESGDSSTPTPTPEPTFTPHDPTPDPTTPIVPTPEYSGIGAGLIALFACFIAFTLFMVRGKSVGKVNSESTA
jgi:hypothetical protein